MDKFRYFVYSIYTLSKYLISTKVIPKIISIGKDVISNIVTVYVYIVSGLTMSYLVFPDQSIILLSGLLDLVNRYYLIWVFIAIGIFQLTLKHRKFIVQYTSETTRWVRALHSASLESAALILLIVGSIMQVSLLFLPPGFLVIEVIAYVAMLRIYWLTRNKWIYSTIRLQ